MKVGFTFSIQLSPYWVQIISSEDKKIEGRKIHSLEN